MSIVEIQREEIRSALLGEPLGYIALLDVCESIIDTQMLMARIREMKEAGEIRRDHDGRYHLATDAEPEPVPKRRGRPPKAPASQGGDEPPTPKRRGRPPKAARKKAAAAAAPKTMSRPKARTDEHARPAAAAAVPGRSVDAALAAAAASAQAALDEYVWSVGDRDILDALQSARDAARDALERYRRGGTS